tara:strand:+ start:544 stop:960 length:417 start_codon:yes stop_codon:yes gene_type:complete
MKTNYAGDLLLRNLELYQQNGPPNSSMKNEKVGLLRRPVAEETGSESEAERAYSIWEMLHTAREEELEKEPLLKNLPFPHFDKEGDPIQHEFQQENMPFPYFDEEGNPIPKGSPDDMIQLLPHRISDKEILELLKDED